MTDFEESGEIEVELVWRKITRDADKAYLRFWATYQERLANGDCDE